MGGTARRGAAAVVTAALAVVLAGEHPVFAAGSTWYPQAPRDVTSVPVVDLEPRLRPSWTADSRVVRGGQSPVWPAAGTAVADVARPTGSAAGSARSRAGSLPVWVGPATEAGADLAVRGTTAAADQPSTVEVSITDRAATAASHVDGLLIGLRRADGIARSARVTVSVDYSGFARAYGGDWASRLRLVRLPSCAFTTPGGVDCQQGQPVRTVNDAVARTLTAEVPLSAHGFTALAAAAGASGDNGDYTATSLSSAGSWQGSAQTGDFSWSYPLRMPPALGGPAPAVTLAYSAGSVDGRTGMTNTQGSWIGDGWDSWPGFVERKYVGCTDDTAAVAGQSPNNANHPTGDQCWKTSNATLSLNGHSGELIQVGSSPVWRLRNDDGTRAELLSDPTRANGDDDNEYWRVTTPDGTRYHFGYHKLPGGTTTSSTWTAPVAGNHPGEPCRAGSFASSFCPQAWRWNLDYVVDPRDNSMAYYYGTETNGYGKDNTPGNRVTYVRGGWLDRIDYGMRVGTESSPAPYTVVFGVADRCLANCWSGSPARPVVASWWDTPVDQDCAAAPCTDKTSPTFWTTKRLSSVTTRVQVSGGTYQDVETWTLRHAFLDAGVAEGRPMWLRGITRAGRVTRSGGPEVSDPEIVFDPGAEPLPNRVEGPSDGRTSLNRFRIKTITTESGGQILVSYSGAGCTRSSLPTPHTNTTRCMPQFYAFPGTGDPTLDWFHKYVVDRVDLIDGIGASATQTTLYDYLDAPAWHYVDDELTKDTYKTWADWRGYGRVRVRTGDANGQQSAVETRYLRGMDGDHLPSGTRDVWVTDGFGGSIEDHEAFQGFVREEVTYNGYLGGTLGAEVGAVWSDPWRGGPTATRTRNDITTNAWQVHTAVSRTRTARPTGGPRFASTVTAFNADGLPVTSNDEGDESVTGDEMCTRTRYARNDGAWMIDKVSQTEALSVRCAAAPDPAAPSTVLARSRTFYDNAVSWATQVPTRGDVTRTEELASFNGSTPSYDVTSRAAYDGHGRVVEAYDALDHKTTTAYTPATGGPVVQTVVTNPLSQSTTTTKEPAWDLPTKVKDANGALTQFAYDGLGRMLKVWLPGRSTTQNPNSRFTYEPRNATTTAVTTETLLTNGIAYKRSVNLYDGFLRLRQNQVQATGGGRLITDTGYDAGGRTDWTSAAYYNAASGPTTTLVTTTGQSQIPAVTQHVYDGAGRETARIFKALGLERWRTSTGHAGDRVHTVPPAGGTATTALSDVYGRTVDLRQYHDPGEVGSEDPTRFDKTTYAYTKTGKLRSLTDPAGNTWVYVYDLRGRTTSSTDPDKGSTVSTHDRAGSVLTSTDARGVTLGYTYDDLGRKTSVREGATTGTKRAEWVYDTLPNGIGKLTRSVRYIGPAAYESRVDAYDPAGRPTSTSLAIPASEGMLCASGTATPCVYSTTTTYKANGAVATSGLPAAADLPAETLSYAYNDIGDQTYFISLGQVYLNAVTYNKIGQLTQRELGAYGKRVVVTSDFDEPTRRPVATTVEPEAAARAAVYAYAHNAAGLITRISDAPPGQAADHQCYRYDHLQRMTGAWTPRDGDCSPSPSVGALGGPAGYWTTWTLDRTGNRTSETSHAAGGGTTTTYTYPPPGSVRPHAVSSVTVSGPGVPGTRGYSYDAAGNTIGRPAAAGAQQALTWDSEGRLASLTESGTTTTVVYDADGNRLVRRDVTGTTLYLPGRVEVSVAAGTSTAKATRYYAHKGDPIAVRTGATLHWLAADHNGTVELAVDSIGLAVAKRRTQPYGQPRGSVSGVWPSTMDKGFVGGTTDGTGLTHLAAREYDPAIGRFISDDPVSDTKNPQQLHGYAYSNNSPASFRDPSGLIFCADNDCGSGSSSGSGSVEESTSAAGGRTGKRAGRGGRTGYALGETTQQSGDPEPDYCRTPESVFCTPAPGAPLRPCKFQDPGPCDSGPPQTDEPDYEVADEPGEVLEVIVALGLVAVDKLTEGLYVDASYCMVVCGSLLFSSDGLYFTWGGIGCCGPAMTAGWNSERPSQTSVITKTICGAVFVGVCGNSGQRNDGTTWRGGGVTIGPGKSLFAGAMQMTSKPIIPWDWTPLR